MYSYYDKVKLAFVAHKVIKGTHSREKITQYRFVEVR